MKLEFSAGGVIIKKDGQKFRFALILNSQKHWTFPKGHIEKREKPEIAALREAKEETGIKHLKTVAPLEKIEYWFKDDKDLIHKYVYYYLMRTKDDLLTPQLSEIKNVQWFSDVEALNNLKYKEDILVIKKVFEYLKIDVI